MQIKTAISIGGGILIGAFVGMCVEEDQKIKFINQIKKKAIYALTGDEWTPKVKYSNPYRTTYSSRCDKLDDDGYVQLLTLYSKETADQLLEQMKNYVDAYKQISVHTLGIMRSKAIDYEWDIYGWTKEQVDEAYVNKTIDEMYKIFLPKPGILKC